MTSGGSSNGNGQRHVPQSAPTGGGLPVHLHRGDRSADSAVRHARINYRNAPADGNYLLTPAIDIRFTLITSNALDLHTKTERARTDGGGERRRPPCRAFRTFRPAITRFLFICAPPAEMKERLLSRWSECECVIQLKQTVRRRREHNGGAVRKYGRYSFLSSPSSPTTPRLHKPKHQHILRRL